jgi:hypothetical protein
LGPERRFDTCILQLDDRTRIDRQAGVGSGQINGRASQQIARGIDAATSGRSVVNVTHR